MAYKKKMMKFKNAIEIEEYHSARYGAPGQTRIKKKSPTKEQIEKNNQKNKEKRCRWRLRKHFDINDYFSTLTYKKENRPPTMKEAKEDFKRFIRQVRDEYKKRGKELKWIRNIEVGTKNGWHVHIVVNRISDTDLILKKAWAHGKVVSELLYERGEFAELASYMTKTPKTDPRLKDASYQTSRNLPLPNPIEKVIRRPRTWKSIKIPKGFYLDENTYREGINPVTGYPYRSYTFLRVRRI